MDKIRSMELPAKLSFVLIFAVIAITLLVLVSAAGDGAVFEAEDKPGSAVVKNDNQASGGKFLSFEQRQITGQPANYADNLTRLQASTFRNTTMDNSPYINTPSAQLNSKSDLFTTEADYRASTGSYNGPTPYFQTEIFASTEAGAFRAECEVSHLSYDDPIVYPGQPEKAHLHTFIGNTHANAYSTYDTLLNSGSSTCNGRELNRTSYWIPSMFDGKGNVVLPYKVRFYYKTESEFGVGKVNTYPENLQLIATNANSEYPKPPVSTFKCNDIYNSGRNGNAYKGQSQYDDQWGETLPNCKGINPLKGKPGVLQYSIFFDHCWNGDTATIGDWQANRDRNMSLPQNNFHSSRCPASNPKLLPALIAHIYYGIPANENTSTWFLASDVDPDTRTVGSNRGSTAHSDWFGAWNKEINQTWVNNCNNVLNAKCGTGALEDTRKAGNQPAMVKRKDWLTGPRKIPVSEVYNQMCSAASSNPISQANGAAAGAYCRP